jgi:hypothetical protein
MLCSSKTPAKRRYQLRLLTASAIYAASLFASLYTLRHLNPSHAFTVVLAIIPSIPIIAMVAIVGFYLKEEKDEFQRDLMIQSLLWGTGCTLAVTSVWGFLEMFSNVPRLPQFYVFVIFWMFVGFADGAVRLRYRGGSNE